MHCSPLWRPLILSCRYFLPPRVTDHRKWLFLCFQLEDGNVGFFLRQIVFCVISVTCLHMYLGDCPFAFVLLSYVSVRIHVYLWLSLFPSLWIGIQRFCCHCIFLLLTDVAICGRPWVIGLYILSLKEVICASLCQCQEKSVWFGVIRVWGIVAIVLLFLLKKCLRQKH